MPARRIGEAGQDGIDVVGVALARIDDQRQVGRQCAVVRGARRLLVRSDDIEDRIVQRIGHLELIRRRRRALLRIALVIQPLRHRDRRGDRLDLLLGQADAGRGRGSADTPSSGRPSRPRNTPGSRAARRRGRRCRTGRRSSSAARGGVGASSCASGRRGGKAGEQAAPRQQTERSARIMPSPSAWRWRRRASARRRRSPGG